MKTKMKTKMEKEKSEEVDEEELPGRACAPEIATAHFQAVSTNLVSLVWGIDRYTPYKLND